MKSRLLLLFITLIFPLFAYSQTRTDLSGYVGDELRLELNPETVYGYTFYEKSPIWEIYSSPGTSYFSLAGAGTHANVNILRYTTGTLIVICRYELKETDGYGYLQKQAYYYITCNAVTIIPEQSNYKLKVGEDEKINYTINPSNKWPAVLFDSDDTSVAQVNNDGYVTGKGPGKATITLSSNMGPEATVSVVVEEGPKKLKLAASPSSGEIVSGTIVTLMTTNASGADIYYTLNGSTPSKSSQKYASPGITINENCTLKAIAQMDGYVDSDILTEKYTILEAISPETIYVTIDKKTLKIQESTNANYEITPSQANVNNHVTWASDNPNIAKVREDGVVTGVGLGTTFIRATTENGVSDYCKVMVEEGTTSNKFNDGMGVVSVSAGYNHTLFLKPNNKLWTCGSDEYGQLDYAGGTTRPNPYCAEINIKTMSAGYFHTLFVKKDNSLWTCGYNDAGQLGNGSTRNTPRSKIIMDDVKMASGGNRHSLILKNDGSVWACGSNKEGQLGKSNITYYSDNPIKVMDDAVFVEAGDYDSWVIKKDGSLWGFGKYVYKDLKITSDIYSKNPVHILDNVSFVSSNNYGTLIIMKDSILWYLSYGKIQKVDDHVIHASAGYTHSVYVKSDGSAWGFGTNYHGELAGDKWNYSPDDPVKVMDGVAFVSAGPYRTFYIKTDGSLWASGENDDGELGDGTTEERSTPVLICKADPGVMPYNITISDERINLKQGEKKELSYSVEPLKYETTVSWTSDDESIVSVDVNGQITAKKPGTTYVNVMTDNGRRDWCKVTVYFETTEKTIKTSADGYATFYDSEYAYSLPSGLSAQIITAVSDKKLTYKTIATGSDGTVPANTAVMLTNEQKKAETYTLKSVWSEDKYSGTNLLHGSDESTVTTGEGLHYKLSYGPNGTKWSDVFGWYWGAENGGAFQIEGHKAWLVLPKSSTRGYTIDGDATGIIMVECDDHKAEYFDLQGRRVGTPTKKGLYIVNGKKVVVK